MEQLLPHHLASRAAHQSRWDNLARSRENYRIALFICLLLACSQSALLWRVVTRGTVQTYVVEVDRFGAPRFAGPASLKQLPEEALWRWTLPRLIHDLRTVPSSSEILRSQLNFATAHLSGNAAETVRRDFEAANPFALARFATVYIEPVVVVLRQGKNLWRVEWTEVRRDLVGSTKSRRWTALVHTSLKPPQVRKVSPGGSDLQYLNPLGLYVTDIDWSLVREL